MKKIILSVATIATITTAGLQNAVADGGVIGNGGVSGVQDSYCSRVSDLYTCLDVMHENLYSAMDTAAMYGQKGQFTRSRAEIRKGLTSALKAIETKMGTQYPLTADALYRGLELDKAFKGSCNQESPSSCNTEARRASMFLAKYVSHVLDTVLPLDLKYYEGSYSYHRSRDWWNGYVIEYKKAAVSLLKLYKNGPGLPESLAVDAYETRIAQLIFSWVAMDISSDDMRRFYGFDFMNARSAANRLSSWNQGTGSFINSRQAVEFARYKADELIQGLEQADCYVSDSTVNDHYNHRKNRKYGRRY